MLTQPCTNLDRHRAPRRAHDPFYNARRRVHKWNCPEQRAKMWVSAIFELTSRVYRAKTRSAIWSRECRGKTPFYKRAFSTSTRSFPLGRGHTFTPLYKRWISAKITIDHTWSIWRSRASLKIWRASVWDQWKDEISLLLSLLFRNHVQIIIVILFLDEAPWYRGKKLVGMFHNFNSEKREAATIATRVLYLSHLCMPRRDNYKDAVLGRSRCVKYSSDQ